MGQKTMRRATLALLFLFVFASGWRRTGFEGGVEVAAAVAREEDVDVSLDQKPIFGETVEMPSSLYGNGMNRRDEKRTKKDDESVCEECVSFLRDVSDQVRSKQFRKRAYKVVDEMCERVFENDRDKKTECEAMGKTYAKKAIEYAKTLLEEEKGEATCEKMHLCKKRRRFWSNGTMEDVVRRASHRARERVASGTFFTSWFSSSSSSSPRKKTRETEEEETQRSLSSPPSSICAFCEYGASKLAMAMNDPDFAESAKRNSSPRASRP